MPTNRYITLASSTGSISKRFKVVGMKPLWDPTDDVQRTINGTLDKSVGSVIATWQYMLRVRPTEEDSNYGTKGDLESLYLLRDPNGTPSDKITLTDHHGSTFECIFLGGYSPENVTTLLEGPSAIYIVPIVLGKVAPL